MAEWSKTVGWIRTIANHHLERQLRYVDEGNTVLSSAYLPAPNKEFGLVGFEPTSTKLHQSKPKRLRF